MIAIDTNVLVRVLVNDPKAEEQCQLARDLIITNKDIWVCRIVLVETVWVLQSSYKFSKDQIVAVLEKLIEHPSIHLEDAVAVCEFHCFPLFNAIISYADRSLFLSTIKYNCPIFLY